MTALSITERIKDEARAIGFDLVGITPASLSRDHLSFFQDWLSRGYAGTMAYLARRKDERADPRRLLEGAKSLICCGLNYFHGEPPSQENKETGHAWISRYAWGEDYHEILLAKLGKLEDFIRREIATDVHLKSYVDTGPILERSHAARAGLGWIGKNTMLIHRKAGSYFFVGEIITDLELVPDGPEPDHCGRCRLCLDACPTQALTPFGLDARRCISYLTIEHRGDIEMELQDKMGNHIFGCDICQEVCPWNQTIPLSREEAFKPRAGLFQPKLDDLEKLNPEGFCKVFQKSAVKRVKPEDFKRNIRITRQNQAIEED